MASNGSGKTAALSAIARENLEKKLHSPKERKLTTILAMDLVGYSRLMEIDEEGTLTALTLSRSAIIFPLIERHQGRVVKLMGDGALVEFHSVVAGLQCAIGMQRQLKDHIVKSPGSEPLRFRIGMHLGDVIVEGDDIYGDGVNIAARLEEIAPPGGIVLSKQVHDHIGSNFDVGFISLGALAVKNISRPIEAYQIEFENSENFEVLRFGDHELDTSQYILRHKGQPVQVEPQVFDILALLARNSERTITREELFQKIWGNRIVSESALSSQIKSVRRAVGDDGSSQHTIATVHGRGFRFVPKVETGTRRADIASTVIDNARSTSHGAAVAVLPFSNLNQEPGLDHLAVGIAEDVITALTRHRWLRVIARNSSFAFRGTSESANSIAQQIGADYLVTGSARMAGSRFRINIEVVDAAADRSVWTERFDRDVADIFEMQDEISNAIASRLEAELGLTEQRKAERQHRKNLGAWDLYHLGSSEFYKFTPEANLRAQDLLRQAITIDGEFAAAYARLAYAIVLSMIYFDASPTRSLMDDALAQARHAIRCDDQDANSFFTLGRVHLARCEYEEAIDALVQAVELNPCLAVTYCGLGDSLAYEGRLDEALKQFDVAIRLSPHDPFRWAFFSYRALAHIFRHEFADAVLWARKSTQLSNAQYWARAHLVSALGHLRDEERIEAALRDLIQEKPEFSLKYARKHLFYIKRIDQLDLYIEGLKLAGVPD